MSSTRMFCAALVIAFMAGTAGCGGANSPNSSGSTTGPVNPPPASLWQPTVGAPPASGSYVYLESEAGDYIGQGSTYTYTPSNALITVSYQGSGHLAIAVTGSESWHADFQAMNTIGFIEPGYYADLQRYPLHNPAKGGLQWTGEGRGCSKLAGWVTVDSISYLNGQIATIDLRFEQHCENATAALHGQLHWEATGTALTGPINPPPAGLWAPAAGATPVSGNYVYLESQAGDYIGQGKTYTYTQTDALISLSATNGHLALSVADTWNGDFVTMNTISQMQPGYYPGLQRYPFHDPAAGGLSWYGDGRKCNKIQGWFVVDSVAYNGVNLSAIDLRFEQHCEGANAALHGQIHWDASNTPLPGGPVYPAPAGLWSPTFGATPSPGNYVYLESEAGDFVGQGNTYTYTAANATLSVSEAGGNLSVSVNGNDWIGSFVTMNTISQMQPGYYPGLQRYPFNDPAVGGLDWSGMGRGCNMLQGWFVVDRVIYSGGVLSAIDLRFEQYCQNATGGLHGKIHWVN